MQVAHAQPRLLVVLGEVLGHPLGERGDQHALLALGAQADLVQQVVDLLARGAHLDGRIHEPGGPDHLLDQRVAGQLQLVSTRRRRDVDGLADKPAELVERQRPVVEGRRQPEAVFHQRFLARAVAVVHAADLRHGHVALVDDHQRVLGQILDQRGRRLARPAPGEMARVVLDPVAVAELPQHLHVEQRALLEPLRFEQPAARLQEGQALAQLLLDRPHSALELLGGGDVVTRRINVYDVEPVEDGALEGIDAMDRLHHVAEQLDPDGQRFLVGGKHLDDVAAHAERPAVEVVVVALVLHGDQPPDDLVAVDPLALADRQVHLLIRLGRADAVDAGDRGHHHHVAPLHQRARRGMAHAVDLVVDQRVLLDVGVRLRDVGLGLVVVVVGDEVFHRVVGEERLELSVELGGQRLVGREHQGRPLHVGDDVGHRVRLARAGDPAQHRVRAARAHEGRQLLDRMRLVSLRGKFRRQSKHRGPTTGPREPRPGTSATNRSASSRAGA